MLRTLLVRGGGKGSNTHNPVDWDCNYCDLLQSDKGIGRNNQQKRAVRCCQSKETNITKKELVCLNSENLNGSASEQNQYWRDSSYPGPNLGTHMQTLATNRMRLHAFVPYRCLPPLVRCIRLLYASTALLLSGWLGPAPLSRQG